MNKTREKILEKSLELFNENGIASTSLRDIAEKMGISVGNLQYHLKKRDDIVEALYFDYVKTVDNIFFLEGDNLLRSFFNIATKLFEICDQYKFILLSFSHICRNNSKIKKHYSGVLRKRELQYFDIIHTLIDNNLFREEVLRDEYSNLFKRLHIITSCWFSSDLIREHHVFNNSIEDSAPILGQIAYPYLTEKGRAQYISSYSDHFVNREYSTNR